MVPSGCGKHYSWPTQGPILLSPYPLSNLRWSVAWFQPMKFKQKNYGCNFQARLHLPDRKANSPAVTFHALSCFFLDSWDTSVMSRGAAAIQGLLRRRQSEDDNTRIKDPEPLKASSNILAVLVWLPLDLVFGRQATIIWEKQKENNQIILLSTLCWACSLMFNY